MSQRARVMQENLLSRKVLHLREMGHCSRARIRKTDASFKANMVMTEPMHSNYDHVTNDPVQG